MIGAGVFGIRRQNVRKTEEWMDFGLVIYQGFPKKTLKKWDAEAQHLWSKRWKVLTNRRYNAKGMTSGTVTKAERTWGVTIGYELVGAEFDDL